MKKVLIAITISIILISSLAWKFKNNNTFYLESKYYNESSLIEIDDIELTKLENNKENFILFTHIPRICTMKIPFDPIVEKFIKEYKISFYTIDFNKIKDIPLGKHVKYSPSVIIYKEGKILTYLNPNSDEDIKYYETYEEFSNWIKKYIKIS